MQTQNETFDLLALMRAGVEHHFVIHVRNAPIKMRLLTALELIDCARETVKRLAENPAHTPVEESILAATIKLEKATTFETGAPLLSGMLLSKMTTAEIDAIYSRWLAECEKRDPSMETIPAEQLEALVEEVKKSPLGATTVLSSRSFVELVNLSRHLIQRE